MKRKNKHNGRWARYVARVRAGHTQAETARHFRVTPQAVGAAVAAAKKAGLL